MSTFGSSESIWGWYYLLDTRDTSEGASELFKHACKDICPCKAVVLDYQCGGVSCPLTFGSLSPLIATVAHAILFWLVVITQGTFIALSIVRIYLILKDRGWHFYMFFFERHHLFLDHNHCVEIIPWDFLFRHRWIKMLYFWVLWGSLHCVCPMPMQKFIPLLLDNIKASEKELQTIEYSFLSL